MGFSLPTVFERVALDRSADRAQFFPVGLTIAQKIKALFAASEQGAWYDPSDMTTLFQDSEGTTPVTAVEQPVGLLLDKRLGLVRGPENLTGFTLSTSTIGSVVGGSDGSLSYVDGVLTVVRNTTDAVAAANNGATFSATYEVTYRVVSGLAAVRLMNGTVYTAQVPGTYRRIIPGGGRVAIWPQNTGTSISIDGISIKELPGNHATQATAAARPVLSGRINLLTKTEIFTTGSWPANNGALTAAAAQDGTLTAGLFVPDVTSNIHRLQQSIALPTTSHTVRIVFKSQGVRYVYINTIATLGAALCVDLETGASITNGASVSNALVTALGDGWYEIKYSGIGTGVGNIIFIQANTTFTTSDNTYVGDGVAGFRMSKPQIETGSVATRYQRVNTATNYDTAGFPRYLKGDGIDDLIRSAFTIAQPFDRISAIAQISWTINKQLFGGVTANAGALFQSTATPSMSIFSGGAVGSASPSLGMNAVITERHAGVNSKLAVNLDVGVTGNAGTVVPGGLTIFASNTAASAEARLYGVLMREGTLTDAQRLDVQKYQASKAGVTL